MIQRFFGRFHQFGSRVLATVVAELVHVPFDLVEIDNGRIRFVREKSRKPGHDNGGIFPAALGELSAGHFGKIELLSMRRQRGRDSQTNNDSGETFHGTMSLIFNVFPG